MTKKPRIYTNEGETQHSVTITCHVIDQPDSTYPVVVKPYKLDISQFGEKVRDEMRFTITNVSDQDVDVTLIAWPNSILEKVDLPKKIKAGTSEEGRVKLREDQVEESFEKSFTFEVNDAAKSRFSVPVKRQVQHASNVAPGPPPKSQPVGQKVSDKPVDKNTDAKERGKTRRD